MYIYIVTTNVQHVGSHNSLKPRPLYVPSYRPLCRHSFSLLPQFSCFTPNSQLLKHIYVV